MSYLLPGNNFNQRCLVHHPDEICRTIIGGGGGTVDTMLATNRK